VRRDVLIIKDPEVAKLFADETRRKILHILRHHDLSTADLARVHQQELLQHHPPPEPAEGGWAR